MKGFRGLTLQWRVTLLTAIVLVISSVVLTVFSILNAQKTLVPLMNDSIIRKTSNGIEIQIVEANQSADPNAGYARTAAANSAKKSFDVKSILFCCVLTTLGTGLVYYISGKALQPVRSLSVEVAKIDEQDLSQRLSESIANDEVSDLTKSFNQMLDRLEQGFKRQKRFSASAAHELKTPLASMKTGIQILRIDENVTLEEYRENARMTETSIDRLTQVVDDLLLLASIGEEKEDLKQEVYLDAMFEAIFSELSPLYDKCDISYEINCGEVELLGNAALLYRVFYNLIDNAYKYTPEKGHISVKVYKVNNFIRIDISDNGRGMSPEHLPLIFEAFYRVDASRSRRIAGSGLGLSIVRSIIERHGGSISVSSGKGQGTCFSVMLPE